MPAFSILAILPVAIVSLSLGLASVAASTLVGNELEDYLMARKQEFDQIPAERRQQLETIARFIEQQSDLHTPARLTFVCTHNSRRSQMSQVWATVAASHFEIENVTAYSGGTEATAFNPRTVKALKRAGLQIEKVERSVNPKYAIRFSESVDPLMCFSKIYDDEPNPKTDYCAIMTCSQADDNCPMVRGSSDRISLPYEDPKAADDTAAEAEAYDARCEQICREMLYVFSRVNRDKTAPQ